jgi:hypothetical protein
VIQQKTINLRQGHKKYFLFLQMSPSLNLDQQTFIDQHGDRFLYGAPADLQYFHNLVLRRNTIAFAQLPL